MNDRELLTAFEAGSVKPETFGHRAHVRVAWAYLQELSAVEALGRCGGGAARVLGAGGKAYVAWTEFHESLMDLWVAVVPLSMPRVGAGAGADTDTGAGTGTGTGTGTDADTGTGAASAIPSPRRVASFPMDSAWRRP